MKFLQEIIERQTKRDKDHTFVTGVPVFTAEGERVGESGTAAKQGIAMVTASRIAMAAPGMVLIPMLMDRLEKKGFLAKYVIVIAIFIRNAFSFNLNVSSS